MFQAPGFSLLSPGVPRKEMDFNLGNPLKFFMLASLVMCAAGILSSSDLVCEYEGIMLLRSASIFKVVAIDFQLEIWYLITTERSVGRHDE